MPNEQAKLALESLRKFNGKEWCTTHLCPDTKTRDKLMIKHKGRPFFKPLSSLPMYKQTIGKNAKRYSEIGFITYLR